MVGGSHRVVGELHTRGLGNTTQVDTYINRLETTKKKSLSRDINLISIGICVFEAEIMGGYLFLGLV